jgi:hypothetical protein
MLFKDSLILLEENRHTTSESIFGKSIRFWSWPIVFHSSEIFSSKQKMNKHLRVLWGAQHAMVFITQHGEIIIP